MSTVLTVSVAVPGRLDVDLELASRCTALVGASGAGKSTLLHVVAGLLPAPGARVHLGGTALDDSGVHVAPERRGIGLQFQESRLFPHLTVRENLEYPVHRGGRGGAPDADDCAAALGIEPLLQRRAGELSGGEARRVALARALAAASDLLLLDEPLGGLDEASRERILPWLHGMLAATRVPTLLVTHRMSEATFLAGEVVALEAGHVVEQGPPLEVLPHFTTVSSRREEDAENLLAGTVAEDGASVHVGELTLKVATCALPAGAPVAVRLRAGDVIVGLSRHHDLSARNMLDGRIVALHEVDDGVLAYVDAGVLLMVSLTRDAVASLRLAPGRAVVLYVKTTAPTLSTGQPPSTSPPAPG